MMKRKYVGLVGPISSGIWVVADLLKEKGFDYYRLSDRIREVSHKRGMTDSRENWQKVGDELRGKYGSDFFARKTIELINSQDGSGVIIDSIRHPQEINYIRESVNALIVGVDAPVGVRFELMKIRKRGVDPLDFEEFKKLDEYELNNKDDDSRQDIKKSLEMVDILFEHDGI